MPEAAITNKQKNSVHLDRYAKTQVFSYPHTIVLHEHTKWGEVAADRYHCENKVLATYTPNSYTHTKLGRVWVSVEPIWCAGHTILRVLCTTSYWYWMGILYGTSNPNDTHSYVTRSSWSYALYYKRTAKDPFIDGEIKTARWCFDYHADTQCISNQQTSVKACNNSAYLMSIPPLQLAPLQLFRKMVLTLWATSVA